MLVAKEINVKLRRFARFALLSIALLAFPVLATAQASRTWVSGVGDDANPCSRTAPCKTFAGAISKTAAGGEIDALDPAGYGAVTITKSITIDGGGGQVASILVSGTPGIVINALNTDVINLRNLNFNGIGTGTYGIRILNAKAVNIEHCAIFGFRGSPGRGVSVELSATNTPAGMLLTIHNSQFFNNAQTHVVILPSSGQPIVKADIANSSLSYSTTNSGIAVLDGGKVTVRNCEIVGNANAGVFADGSVVPGQVLVDGSNISFNALGVGTSGGAAVRLSGTVIANNGGGLSIGGGPIYTFGTNRIEDNGGNNGTGMTAVTPSIPASQK